MKAIVGTAPNLPWWRLCSMSDVEIEKFNRGYMVEIEMFPSAPPNNMSLDEYHKLLNKEDEIWNAAIEAAADEMPISDEGFELNARIRKLKK